MGIAEDTQSFETFTDNNLDVSILGDLAEKYTYIKGTGMLTSAGIMTDTEKEMLNDLDNANANFQAAVEIVRST